MRVVDQQDPSRIEDREILREFLIESHENLLRLEQEVAQLEFDPNNAELLASIFRAVHSIKGACGFLGFSQLESIAHETESLLSQIRKQRRHPSPRQISQVLDGTNRIASMLRQIEAASAAKGEAIETIWNRLPHLVDHLSHSLGKQVHLEMDVATQLDRAMIEAIKDPLTHLVRNACDHGIETPDDRLRSGKPAHGSVQLRAYQQDGHVHIEISDDGAGMTPDVLDLVFLPGFSTAKQVTKISGRGVGMDIVKANIERIGGSVEITARPGQGTTVTLRIPLQLHSKDACNAENYRYLQDFLYQHSGIVLEAEKHHLLEARLLGLVREQGVATINGLCSLLRASKNKLLKQQVVDALTTNETYFFRESEHYDALRQTILPRLLADRRRLRFWSAASSTGQEAFSLAMLLREMGLGEMGLTKDDPTDVEILGTDLSTRVLDRARAGIFSRLEMTRGLPASYAEKYFSPLGPQWCVNDDLKRMVRFQSFDLRSSMRDLGTFDAVFCRNVLIYFDLPTKLRIIDEIHRTLSPGGHLFLGSTESDLPVSDRYQRKSIGAAIVFVAR